ncbi:MAG: hypothetical protein AAFU79_02065 [Myxococcota bacterium]
MLNTAIVDCDGVLSDFALEICQLIDFRLTPDDITRWDFTQLLGPLEREAVLRKLRIADTWEKMKPTPWAKELLSHLRDLNFDVKIVTSPWYMDRKNHCFGWCETRYRWLDRHFGIPASAVHFAKDKRCYPGAVMIDDKPENVRSWNKEWPVDHGFLWELPHNAREREGLRVLNAENFRETLRAEAQGIPA